MDNGFSVLMLIFGAALLLYALILSSGNPNFLPYRVQPTLQKADKPGQTKRLGRITAVVGLTPLIGGMAGLIGGNLCCLIVMAVVAGISIAAGIMKSRSKNDPSDEN